MSFIDIKALRRSPEQPVKKSTEEFLAENGIPLELQHHIVEVLKEFHLTDIYLPHLLYMLNKTKSEKDIDEDFGSLLPGEINSRRLRHFLNKLRLNIQEGEDFIDAQMKMYTFSDLEFKEELRKLLYTYLIVGSDYLRIAFNIPHNDDSVNQIIERIHLALDEFSKKTSLVYNKNI